MTSGPLVPELSLGATRCWHFLVTCQESDQGTACLHGRKTGKGNTASRIKVNQRQASDYYTECVWTECVRFGASDRAE